MDMLRRSKSDPRWFLRVDPEFLVEMLEPLGLQNRRAKILGDLAVKWYEIEPETRADVRDLPGCGNYACDSWSIFVENDYDVNPTDSVLRGYVERVKKASKVSEEA